MLHSLKKKGNALVDLIIGMIIMGLVSISVVGAYTSLMSMASNAFRNSQASWMGNSVMEIYSAKAFDDIDTNDSFTLDDQFPGYTANVTVVEKDVDLSTNTIDDGDESSNYKEITAVISGPGVDDILTYTTLRSNCTQAGPYITGISTDWGSDYAKNGDDVVINVTFNRKIDVANNDQIILNLNVAERTGSQENYSVSSPNTPINVTGSTLAGDRVNLSFTYTVGQDHTSSALDNYLDVSSVDLSGATITGFDGSASDGCLADLELPIAPAPTLADDQVIIRLIPGVYYIFHDWATMQAKINPEGGGGMQVASFEDVFNTWQRFNGGSLYDDAADAAGDAKASAWVAQYRAADGQPTGFSSTFNADTYDTFDHFYMPDNVTPGNGFVSPNEYSNFILEATLNSTDSDDDMIGLIIAFEKESTDLCNNAEDGHDPSSCSSAGTEEFLLMASRSPDGAVPNNPDTHTWAILYSNTNVYKNDWYGGASRGWTTAYGESSDKWYVASSAAGRTNDNDWRGASVRLQIQRANNIITAKTTDWDEDGEIDKTIVAYLTDHNLTVDLADDRRLHKFVKKADPDNGSYFGYVTYSQRKAKFLDNDMPEPPVESNLVTGYVVYFHDRESSENDGIYDSWEDYNMETDVCCATEAGERSYNPIGSGIWKYDAGTTKWVFQEGLDIQELNGNYGIITPNPDGESDAVEEDGKTTKYFIKQVAENGN